MKKYIKILKAPFIFLWSIVCWLYKLVIRILSPLKVIKQQQGIFFLWFLFTIIAGLMGPIINILNNCCFGTHPLPLELALFQESMNGTFYTFSVVMIASSIGVALMKLIDFNQKFQKVKLYFVAICVFPLLIGAVCYSSHMRVQTEELEKYAIEHVENNKKGKPTSSKQELVIGTDEKQLWLFIISIIIAIYAFCLQYMSLNPKEFEILDDSYTEDENDRVDRNVSNVSGTTYNNIDVNG